MDKEVRIIGQPHSQASCREDDVLLNDIAFDIFAEAIENEFYTADMQRQYRKARYEKRTVYYACRAISTQKVEKMAYEKLKPVHISFIMTEDRCEKPVKHVKLCDIETHEIFDDILEITLVYVPAVLRTLKPADKLYLFSKFFMVSSQEEADEFAELYKDNELGKELTEMYNESVKNVTALKEIEDRPYFTWRLTEAEREEIREEARKEARKEAQIETWKEATKKIEETKNETWGKAWEEAMAKIEDIIKAKELIKFGHDNSFIVDSTGLPEDIVVKLRRTI
jgi:hypothetical protein